MLVLLLKLTILLLAALAALWTTRNATARLRHGLCLGAIMAALVLPLAGLVRTAQPLVLNLSTVAKLVGQPAGGSHAVVNWTGEGFLLLWAAGTVMTLGWFVVGYWRVGKIRGNTTEIGAKVSTADVHVPVAVGLIDPAILVPRDFESWPETLREAAIRHESAHIERKDLWANLVSHLVCATYWFHPLVWMLRSRLRTEQELACDEAVVKGGFDPADYARSLVTVARRSMDGLTAGCEMASRADVTTRVKSVLAVRKGARWPVAVATAGLLAVFATTLTPIRAETIYSVGPTVSSPRLLDRIEPQYTEEARKAMIEGAVALSCVIRPDGMAHDIFVVTPLDPGLDRNAAEAIEKWHFAPGIKDGEPVAVRAMIEVNFKLE